MVTEIETGSDLRTRRIAFSDDSSLCATLSSTGPIRLYDTADWSLRWETRHPSRGRTSGGDIQFISALKPYLLLRPEEEDEPIGQMLGVTGKDGAVYVLSASNGSVLDVWRGESAPGVALGLDDAVLRSAHANGVVKAWDAHRPRPLDSGLDATGGSLTFLSDGRGLLVQARAAPRAMSALRMPPVPFDSIRAPVAPSAWSGSTR